MRVFLKVLATLIVLPGIVAAETELSLYGGVQGAPHGRVSGNDPGGAGPFSFIAGWEGRSGENPL